MNNLWDPLNLSDSLVLIADDNAITVQLLCALLKKEGINYIFCSNGAQVLTLAKEKLPDLILMDVMMPQIDGFEACKRLKGNLVTTDIPVIFLTAKAETVDKLRGFEVGGADYILKPFEKTEVLVRIKTHIKLKKAMDKLNSYKKWLEKLINDEIIDKKELPAFCEN